MILIFKCFSRIRQNGWIGRRLWQTLLQAFVLVLAAPVIYSPVYQGEFLWDDKTLVTSNWMVKSGTLGGLAAIWLEPDGPDYFPLTYTSLWLAWQVFGDDPIGYHVTNVALHVLSGLLIWSLLNMLRIPGSWLAALVFTVHPVCVQSVAWISEIKNTLSLPLFLLSCLFWVGQDSWRNAATRYGLYGAAVLAFVLAMLAKPTMVGMPFLALLYGWWKRREISRLDVLRVSPLLVFAAIIGLITVLFQQERAIAGESLPISGCLTRFAVAGTALVFYLSKIACPIGLVAVYPQWSVNPIKGLQLFPWVALSAVALLSWRARATWGRNVILASGFFLTMIFPVLGFIDMAYMRMSWVSDHFLYLPMIGPIAGFVGMLTHCAQKKSVHVQAAGVLLGGVAVLLLGVTSFFAAERWVSSETLWSTTLERNPEAWVAHVGLGQIELARRRLETAADHYRRAGELRPALWATQHYCDSIVEILLRRQRYDEALELLKKLPLNVRDQVGVGGEAITEYRRLKSLQKAARRIEELQRGDQSNRELGELHAEVTKLLYE